MLLVVGCEDEDGPVGPHPPYFRQGVVVGTSIGAEDVLELGESEEELPGELEVKVVPEVVVGVCQPLVGKVEDSGDDDVQVVPEEVVVSTIELLCPDVL